MTKEEILSELYGLRAGLSVISQNCDIIRDHEDTIEKAKKDLKINLAHIQNTKGYYIPSEESSLKIIAKPTFEESINGQELKQRITYRKAVLDGERDYPPINGFWKRILIWFFSLYTISAIILNYLSNKISIDKLPVLLIVTAIIWTLTFLLTILPPIRQRKQNFVKEYNDLLQEYEKQEKEFNKSRNARLAEQKLKIKELNEKLVRLNNEYSLKTDELNENEPKLLQENEKIANYSKELTNILKKKYEQYLLEADWGNVDLVIFYFQTGRADSIKEALLLADQERQTRDIVRSISQARIAITGTINTGFQALGSAMIGCFSRLSDNITSELRNVNRTLQSNYSLNEQMYRQNEQLQEQTQRLISATELNNALQEKANTTSETLLNDLRYQQKYWIK